jgi:hypothetical protein
MPFSDDVKVGLDVEESLQDQSARLAGKLLHR